MRVNILALHHSVSLGLKVTPPQLMLSAYTVNTEQANKQITGAALNNHAVACFSSQQSIFNTCGTVSFVVWSGEMI